MAVPDRLLVDFAAFAGGFSAWAGSREGRRKTEDLLGTTVRPAWARQLAALAGTMFWLVLAFLLAVALLYIQIAHAVIWGGPPLWSAWSRWSPSAWSDSPPERCFPGGSPLRW
jgi:hypothetical protein